MTEDSGEERGNTFAATYEVRHRIKSAMGAAIIIFSAGLVANLIYWRPAIGPLQPANEPVPPNTCDAFRPDNRPAGSPTIVLGKGALIPSVVPNAAVPSYETVQVGKCMALNIRRDQDGMTISTEIYARDGRLIGRLRDNRYSIGVTQRLKLERSADLSALVVYDKRQGEELLFVKFLNPMAIRIRGIFTCPFPSLQTVTVTDDGVITSRGNLTNIGCISGGQGIGFSDPPDRAR